MYYVNRETWESSWIAPKGYKRKKEKEKEKNKNKNKKLPAAAADIGSMLSAINSTTPSMRLRKLSVVPGARPVVDPRMDLMSALKGGAVSLKKAEPLAPKPVDARDQMLNKLKGGLQATLKKVEIKAYDATENMDEAVAQLLANRHAIAGDESDSDSDSDYEFDSDDDYP